MFQPTPKYLLAAAALGALGFWGVAASAFGAQAVAPEVFPAERYAALSLNCPFIVAAPAAPVLAPAGPTVFANLFVSAAAQLTDAGGHAKDVITVKSRLDQSTFTLTSGGEPNKDGIVLDSVEWSNSVGKTKVNVKKGLERGTLEFDQANLQGPAQAPGVAPRPGPGMMPPTNGGRLPIPLVKPGMPPVSAIPRPVASPGQPQMPGYGQPQPGAQPGAGPAGTPDMRRRIRVINSNP